MIARFITSTGTGIGKTLVTAALTHQLRQAGRSVRALKPIVTGLNEIPFEDSDPAILLKSMGRSGPAHLNEISPFRFAAPLAPSMAARREGRILDLNAVVASCEDAANGLDEVLLIEGVGGVMVPLAPGKTVLDWMGALGHPAILVTGSYLGSISHTLTALAALRAASIAVAGVVVSESADSTVGLSETAEELGAWSKDTPILALPRIEGPDPWLRAPVQLTALAAGSVKIA